MTQRRLLPLMAALFAITTHAMKIEKDEIDEFTGERTIMTSWESICGNKLHIGFRTLGDKQFVDVRLVTDDPILIDTGDLLGFKSDSGNIATFKSRRTYTSKIKGNASSGAYNEIYASYAGDLGYFKDNLTSLIRIYATDGYYDKKIDKSDGEQLKKLYGLLVRTESDEIGTHATLSNYTITFIKSSNGGRVWDIIEERFIKNGSPDEINDIISDWKSRSDGNILYDCKVKRER